LAGLSGGCTSWRLVLLAGLVILLIHLAFYPWPDVFRRHPTINSP
jgi:hypothetical protein